MVGGIGLSWQQVGTLLFVAVVLLALWQVARRDDMRGLLLASLLIAIAFFVLPTRVHERYLFPALALAAPLLLSGRVWPWVYGGLSAVLFLNMYWAYTEDWSFSGRINNPGANGQPMPQDPFLTSTLLTDWGIWLLVLLGVVLLGIVAWQSLRLSLTPATEPDRMATPLPEPARPPPQRSVPAAWAAAVPSGGTRFAWLSPKAADAYFREPWRRLDRRDALILLAVVAFALIFRLWRLDIPRSQHFDEVYHGRSATEWLSAWQEGWDRDVYEWTHPMLAKYLIAGGIVAADPNKVSGTTPLGEPSSALAVAPRREASGRERSVAFTVEGPSTVVASDAVTGEELSRWEASGPIASLAYDPEAPRLLVGRADNGTIETYELAGLLASPDGRAPPAGPPISTELGSVSQVLVATEATDPVLARGPDGVAVIERATDAVLASAEGAYGGIGLVHGVDDEPDAVAVTDAARGVVTFLDATTLEEMRVVDPSAPLIGPLITRGSGDDQQIFALTGPLGSTDEHPATEGGIAAIDADGQTTIGLVPLPGAGSLIGLQRVAGMVYVAGTAPDGAPETWAIEPHVEARRDGTIGAGAFDTTPLPGTPLAMAFDVASTSQGDDHAALIVSTADPSGEGALVRIDAGSNAFAWRLGGVVFGAALVGLVYLMAATMFSRRRVAVLAAAFVAIDGMSFVMSRISMNDIYVATFVVAAYTLFWQVWSGRWARSAWWAMPLVGVLIGLSAATKWVGFYAMAGLIVLVLARSALGRLVLVGAIALAAIVGGLGAPWPFLVIMLGLLGLALAITWARPIRLDLGEALTAVPATIAILTGVGLAFVLAVEPGRVLAHAGQRGRVRLRAAGPRRGGGVARLSDDGHRRRAPRLARDRVAARPCRGRSLVPPRRDERLCLGLDGRVPGGRPAGGLRAELRALPPARPRLDRGRWSRLRVVARGAARADVRLPLQPDRRARQRLAVVELAARPEADMVLQRHVRQRLDRGHLQRRQPRPLLGRGPGHRRRRRAGLETTVAGPRPHRGRLRLPARSVGADRAGHVRVPLLHRRDLRHGGRRLHRRRAPAPAGLA